MIRIPPCLVGPAAALLLAVPAPATAQELAQVRPETVGLSTERLARLSSYFKDAVADRQVAGVVMLVLRDGKVAHYEATGVADVERASPMQRSTIFRIASQSKALTSVAVMTLVEEGKIRLGDPVSRFIPAFAHTTVAVDSSDGQGRRWIGRVAANRPITIRDLLTHTSGVSYGGGHLDSLYRAAGFHSWYFADQNEPIGTSIERLATLPFEAQPGAAFVYGYNTDILGYVVEKASGMSLADYLDRRIFQPLEMRDTYFFLPPDKAARLAAVYSGGADGHIVRAPDSLMGQGNYVKGPRKSFSGGAGLLSTARDYGRFLQMLLNGGELGGKRILSPKTVQLMTANQVGNLFDGGSAGFGLGFQIQEPLGRSDAYGSEGTFGWGGAYATNYWVDPVEKLVGVFMVQLLPTGPIDLPSRVRQLVYQAVTRSNLK